MQARGFAFDATDFDTRFELGGHPLVRRLRTGSLRNHSVEAVRDLVFRAWPGHSSGLQALAARNEALAQSVLEVTDKRVFLDSSKVHMRIKYLLQYSDLDISVIHLVRDARGVVTSTLGHKPGTSAQQAAQSWVHRNNNIHRHLASLPEDKHIRVRYEDVCRNTQNTLAQICRFCGVAPHYEVTDFRSVEHHVVGNQMRLRASSEIRLDERWKRELDEAQLAEIDQVAGDMGHHYGYR
jgi:hypothetical protein